MTGNDEELIVQDCRDFRSKEEMSQGVRWLHEEVISNRGIKALEIRRNIQ